MMRSLSSLLPTPPRSTQTTHVLFVALTAFLALGMLAGCGPSGSADADAHAHTDHDTHDTHDDANGSRELTLAAGQRASLDIETVVVDTALVGAPLALPARMVPVPDQEALVTSLIDGRIEQVLVNEGDRVRAGQPVASVTGAVLGDYVAKLRRTRADLDRQERLTERGVGVRRSLIEARTTHAAARQHLRALGVPSATIDVLATGTDDADGLSLRAPTDGVVLRRTATRGGPVSPGQVLFRIAGFSPIWVEADAYEHDLAAIRQGMPVRVTAASEPERTYTGAVAQVVPRVDRERRVVTVRIQLTNDDKRLMPGMFATVHVLTGRDEQPALPVQAVQTDGAQSYVIVASTDSTFRRVDVAASADAGGAVPVPELAVGTHVVTAGAFQIHSAMTGVEAGHAH